ncbi:MAG: M20/M25/M40 family metallo-hydrolase [Planctomycetota bacterium]
MAELRLESLSSREANLCRGIESRAAALLDDLRLHVELPTGGNNLAAIDETRDRFRSRLEALGAKTTLLPGEAKPEWLGGAKDANEIPPTAICDRAGDGAGDRGRPRVLIAGHLDTVHDPGGDFRELSIAADGRTALGPGCVDMKGGLVIAVAALEALEEAGIPVAWSFLMNADEETGTYHSAGHLRDAAERHDWGIALEPALAGGELAIERVGSGQFMIECRGKAAHVGRAFTDGVSAVTKLAECLVAIGEMPEPERGKILNVGPIQGGAATNAVPDRAMAWGNVRFPDPAMSDEIGRELDALATAADALPGVTVHRSFNRPAKPLRPDTERLGLAARAAAEDLGQSLPFAKTGGVCDGNIMQDAGLPTIDTLGVRGGGLHTPDEWIELPSLVERCQLLAVLLSRLAEGRLEQGG